MGTFPYWIKLRNVIAWFVKQELTESLYELRDDDFKMEIEVGPFVDSPYASVCWKFIGVYNGACQVQKRRRER